MTRVAKTNYVYKLNPTDKPALTIRSGDTVTFELEDGFSGVITSNEDSALKVDFARVLPATGPVYVDGAMPGDVLAIIIKDIKLDKQGAVLVLEQVGVLKDKQGALYKSNFNHEGRN